MTLILFWFWFKTWNLNSGCSLTPLKFILHIGHLLSVNFLIQSKQNLWSQGERWTSFSLSKQIGQELASWLSSLECDSLCIKLYFVSISFRNFIIFLYWLLWVSTFEIRELLLSNNVENFIISFILLIILV